MSFNTALNGDGYSNLESAAALNGRTLELLSQRLGMPDDRSDQSFKFIAQFVFVDPVR